MDTQVMGHRATAYWIGALLAALALALTAAGVTALIHARTPTYSVYTTDDGRAASRQPADPPTQRCETTRTDPDNFPVWDCDQTKTDPAPFMRFMCVQTTQDATEPYILCSSARSAKGLAGRLG